MPSAGYIRLKADGDITACLTGTCIAHGHIQVRICVAQITKRAAREPQHTARMTVRERDFEPVRGRVRKPMYAVCQEIVILALFAVRDDRGSRGFEPFDGVSNCIFVERGKGGVLAIDLGEFLDEVSRPRNAANGLRRYGEQGRLSVGHACTSISLGRVKRKVAPPAIGGSQDRLWTCAPLRYSCPARWGIWSIPA